MEHLMPESMQLSLPPEQWQYQGVEPFSGRRDHRGLLQVRDPWVASQEGAHGWLLRALVAP
jgi:hypothetical protein